MRYASFAVSGANGDKVDISIVTFPGTGGSDADNVNRWRRQIGLPPVEEKRDGLAGRAGTRRRRRFFCARYGFRRYPRHRCLDPKRGSKLVLQNDRARLRLVETEKTKFFDFLRSIQFNS